MGIWIRSQNKRHLKLVNEISIFNSKFITDEMNSTIRYVPNDNDFIIKCDNLIFGKFTSEEEAMKVVEEITQLLRPKMIIKFNEIIKPEDLKLYQEKTDRIALNHYENLNYVPIEKFYQIPENKTKKNKEGANSE